MPRFERSELVAKFQAMKAEGTPIVGGGAGTGLSAKSEEAGPPRVVLENGNKVYESIPAPSSKEEVRAGGVGVSWYTAEPGQHHPVLEAVEREQEVKTGAGLRV